MALPILSVSLCSSVCFGTYRNCLHYLCTLPHGSSEVKPSRFDVFVAGCSAGTAEAMVFAPIDLIKIRQQNQTHPHNTYHGPATVGLLSKAKYRGPIHCMMTVLNEEGICGLYRGITALWLRDIPCFGLYFLSYSIFTEWLTPQGQDSRGWSSKLLAGGWAGVTYWVLATPMDVMKSRMQMDGMGQRRYTGVLNCITKSFKREGIRVFFKGLTLNCLRAFPVNGVTFVTYETILELLKKTTLKE
uniref:Solute carrier family 25 member 47-like protein n=1 Tax=Callorhinchus milii TaxID=7868 RepID=V9L3B1_CALMI